MFIDKEHVAKEFLGRNFQKEMDKVLMNLEKEGRVPKLLLHSCCAPCSSYCIEYLSNYFEITVFYYNPNISEEPEYRRRVEEQKKFIRNFPAKYPVSFLEGDYDAQKYFARVKGLEKCQEGGERCFVCYEMRLDEAARKAKEPSNGLFLYNTDDQSVKKQPEIK